MLAGCCRVTWVAHTRFQGIPGCAYTRHNNAHCILFSRARVVERLRRALHHARVRPAASGCVPRRSESCIWCVPHALEAATQARRSADCSPRRAPARRAGLTWSTAPCPTARSSRSCRCATASTSTAWSGAGLMIHNRDPLVLRIRAFPWRLPAHDIRCGALRSPSAPSSTDTWKCVQQPRHTLVSPSSHPQPITTAIARPSRTATAPGVVGRGHVSLLTGFDACHAKLWG